MDYYAAGLIDGEGHIGINVSNKASGKPTYAVILVIGMSDKGLPALQRMERVYGGRIDHYERRAQEHRDLWRWRLSGEIASRLIRQLLPAFLIKTEAAEVALNLQDAIDNADRRPNGQVIWTPELRRRAELSVDRIKEANRRGPDPKLPDRIPLALYQGGAWWEPADSLFGPVLFEGRWPNTGMMRSGRIYELTEMQPTTSSPLLPTPSVADGMGGHATRSGSRSDELLLPGVVKAAAEGKL